MGHEIARHIVWKGEGEGCRAKLKDIYVYNICMKLKGIFYDHVRMYVIIENFFSLRAPLCLAFSVRKY